MVEPEDGNSNSALNDSSQIWDEEISSPGDTIAAEQSSSERVSSYETITSQTVAESALFELASKASNASLSTRKRNNDASAKDAVDMLLGKASIEERKGTDEHDADVLFCKSLIHILKKIKGRKNRELKIEIERLLLKYEFGDDENSSKKHLKSIKPNLVYKFAKYKILLKYMKAHSHCYMWSKLFLVAVTIVSCHGTDPSKELKYSLKLFLTCFAS